MDAIDAARRDGAREVDRVKSECTHAMRLAVAYAHQETWAAAAAALRGRAATLAIGMHTYPSDGLVFYLEVMAREFGARAAALETEELHDELQWCTNNKERSAIGDGA